MLAIALWTTAMPIPSEPPPDWFWGCWTVVKVIPTSGIFGISEKQEKSIIGTHLVFSPTCARSGQTVIDSATYKVKVLSAEEFFRLGHFALSQIGVQKSSVTEVELILPDKMSDLNFPGNQAFLRDNDLVINVENVSFLAQRAKKEDANCNCKASPIK